jgi:hypothetical protein
MFTAQMDRGNFHWVSLQHFQPHGSRRANGSPARMCRTKRLDENYGRMLIMVCVLLDLCSCSIASPSPGSSTPERCHPEDVLVSHMSSPYRRMAGRAAQVDKLVLGVAQGARYEARLRLVRLGFTVHEEWLQFHGAVEQDDQAQRISFAVPPLLAGRYKEHFDVYDACGFSASLSACNEDDQLLRLLSKMNIAVDLEEAVQGHSIYRD